MVRAQIGHMAPSIDPQFEDGDTSTKRLQRGLEQLTICRSIGGTVNRICSCGFESDGTQESWQCPNCQAINLSARLNVADSAQTRDQVSAHVQREGEDVSFTQSAFEGRTSSSRFSDGRLELSMTGSSPQGEADTRNACLGLMHHLNSLGATWTSVEVGAEPAEMILVDEASPRSKIEIQVVRANASQAPWRSLANSSLYKSVQTPQEAAQILKATIESKGTDLKIPRGMRSDLTLEAISKIPT